jgi:Predicted aminoglycoside phosphotransferase
MSAYRKPVIDISEIQEIIKHHIGSEAASIRQMEGGNMSSVFSCDVNGQGYVIKFSDLEGAFDTEHYVANLLASQDGIPFPACLAMGHRGQLTYVILERLEGRNLSELAAEDQLRHVPHLVRILFRLADADVSATSGYGWIRRDGQGSFASWKEFVTAAFAEDQTGTFWENWHELYRTTCLERDVFTEIYDRLMHYVPYGEPHRHFVHGDYHPWNILSDGARVTGIIDGLYMYGDPLIDLAVLDRHMPWAGIVAAYQAQLEQAGRSMPHFTERLRAAYYFKGLDGLRFYAKMGWTHAYMGTRQFLLQLE